MPLCAVTKATVEPSWRRVLRGTPGRGMWIPGALCLGVREHAGTQDFVAIRPRKHPVTRIDFHSTASPFARIVISDRVPQATGAMVRSILDRLPRRLWPVERPHRAGAQARLASRELARAVPDGRPLS